MAEINNAAAITRRIVKLSKSLIQTNNEIQEIAFEVLTHISLHRSANMADQLLNAIPANHKRSLVARWFTAYSPVVLQMKKGKYAAHLAKEGKSRHFKAFNLDGAKATPFWEVEAEKKAVVVFDPMKAIKSALIKGELSPEDAVRLLDEVRDIIVAANPDLQEKMVAFAPALKAA